MDENIVTLKKTVYNREHLQRIVDRGFNTFTQPVQEDLTPTIEDFFALYEELFYEIPINGPEGTHEYLVTKSQELYKLEESNDDIAPLLDEISNLRAQIINNETEIIALQEQIATLRRNVNN
ncbi:MAG: hypothetical protein ACO22Y_00195 [Sediminibacterium sp.]